MIINHTAEQITFYEKGNVNARVLEPFQKMFYTWVDPAGERKITWNNSGKNSIENDLRRDGVDEFIISEAGESSTGKRRGSSASQGSASNKIWWISFLDGTQRVLLFTKNPSVALGNTSASRLDQVS